MQRRCRQRPKPRDDDWLVVFGDAVGWPRRPYKVRTQEAGIGRSEARPVHGLARRRAVCGV